ncbi:SCO family protein [Stenotrophomonas hibiscicola]|uniref:SCO family protein n=1 Tax=Stenotrophomonas hibiscicola TaxID=86189 RepID=UPI0018D2FBE2|nr:SCO family protein [[Pseudomonas] hibiscicola]MBH1443217.1 SCO family protein [Stenotrophomonas maltophilia]MBN7848277.1 SCO family protein [Stenotrophomonas maltophilia]
MFNRNAGIILLIALAAGLGLLAAQQVFAPKPPANAPATEAITLYPQPRELPDFNLAQSDGTRLIPGELKGHWTLVFLGFTFCPDVCPTTLAELAGAQNQWEALPDSLRPRVLFISVDPDRDSATRLGEYAHGFHKDTLAATADIPSLERFATSLGFVFQKVPGKHFDENPEDYTVEHSASLAVLDPQGRLAGLVRPPFNAPAIARDLQKLTEKTSP